MFLQSKKLKIDSSSIFGALAQKIV